MQRIIGCTAIALFFVPIAWAGPLQVRHDQAADTISVYRMGHDEPLLTQHARPGVRPYIHPLVAPDGKLVLTASGTQDISPRNGLYWGLGNVNGRDYFHHPGPEYWRRVSVVVLQSASSPTDPTVRWQTVYDLLDEKREPILRETHTWSLRDEGDHYDVDFQWRGAALSDVTVGGTEHGGLFLSMPAHGAQIHNSIRQTGARAHGQRAVWVDVGMQVAGREDVAHIAIFDHAENPGYPQLWNVDAARGFGPVTAGGDAWSMAAGQTAVMHHQLRIYTGVLDAVALTSAWSSFATPGRRIATTDWDLAELDQFAAWHLADVATSEEAKRAAFLAPKEAADAMTLAAEFRVNVYAAEPMITQPMAFCWDDRGRLWIAQNRDYDGVARGIERSGASRILILEDTDGDGVADSQKVFLEDVVCPSAIAVGLGGLWLGAVPNLLFVPDRDGDDRADVDDIEIRLTGWGQADLHEILNSFHWGPDGWLYGLQGVFTPSWVGKPAGRSRIYRPGPPGDAPTEIFSTLAHPGKDAPFRTVADAFAAGGNCRARTGSPDDRDPDDRDSVCLQLPREVSAGSDVSVTVYTRDGEQVDLSTLQDVEIGFGEAGFVLAEHGTLDTSSGRGIFTITAEMLASDRFNFYARSAPADTEFEYDGEPTYIDGGVWRYHPTKDRFEVVAHGFSNPWGIDYDAKGQLFLSACVIPHLWHVVPGGVYQRQSGSHVNQHVYDAIRTIANHRHRSAHGGARVYLSDAFPKKYQGRIFMGNIHEHAVLTDILERRGSGFVGHHGDEFLLANNAQFVGFSMEIGPDGAVYVLDWHDAEICSGPVRNRDTGRVYRISPLESLARPWPGRYADLGQLSDLELVHLQLSESAWHARRARVQLQHRAAEQGIDREAYAALRKIFDTHASGDYRLRALWALHVTGGIAEEELLNALGDKDEYVRSWAVQLLCEDVSPSPAARAQFVRMAAADTSPVVRLYLAAALQRMGHEFRWPIARQLAIHSEDSDDHNIPKMIWYGIEPAVSAAPEQALEIARQTRIGMLAQHIARRLTVDQQLTGLVDELSRNVDARLVLLRGMRDGLEGMTDVEAPPNWTAIYRQLRRDDRSAAIALELSLRFGDAVAADLLWETLQDTKNPTADRRRALRGLAEHSWPELKRQLPTLLDDESLRADAIRAVGHFEDSALAKMLLDRYATFSQQDKLDVVHALASRTGHGWQLTQAIRRGDVPRRDIPNYLARVLLRSVGNRFRDIWGPVDAQSAESAATFAKYRSLLEDEGHSVGDPRQGRVVFQRTCAACHQMYGEGGRIGPDLTGANRTDLNYLLGNILTPSAVVHDDYRMTLVFTDDGQVYSGVVENEGDRQLRLRVANADEPVTIAVSRIQDREITTQSMMPNGLLDRLADTEVIDLFAYLRDLRPSPTTASSQ